MHYRSPRRSEKGAENLFEVIIAENFPNLGKEKDVHVQEIQKVPNKINPIGSTPVHIITKIAKFKDKDRILKGAREK